MGHGLGLELGALRGGKRGVLVVVDNDDAHCAAARALLMACTIVWRWRARTCRLPALGL